MKDQFRFKTRIRFLFFFFIFSTWYKINKICYKKIFISWAKFEFLPQPACSRAETLYLFGLLGRGAELGAGARGGGRGGRTAVKVGEIDRLRGELGDRHQILAEGNWKTKVHLLTLPGWRESWGRQFILLKEILKNFFSPSNVDGNIISDLLVSVVLIPFVCANLEMDY